ncbi:MAG: cation:proton antiporter [Trueperaceae bacterium]|nr:cation:proton antiporter [Trueperaceae bacterium]
MRDIELVLVTIGGLVLFLGVWSNFLRRRTFVPEPFVALLVGVALGPSVLGWLDPAEWADPQLILKEAARLTLAVALMAITLRIPPRYLRRHARELVVMIAVVMPLMWLASGLVVFAVLGLPIWVALLVGAALTPTDPIVTTSLMIGGFAEERLPSRIRDLLSFEAGANDGLAYPLLVLPMLFLSLPTGEAVSAWFAHTWLWEIGGALVIGAALGYAAGRTLTWSERHDLIERHSFLAYSLALTLLTLGVAEGAGTEGVLAVFTAGLAFSPTVGGEERAKEEGVQEAISQFFYLPVFTLLGMALPWQAWAALGPGALALILGILLLRRLPAVLLATGTLRLRGLHGLHDRAYVGWFGPIGISTILYALIAVERTGIEEVWIIGSLLVFVSTAVHGVSANPLTRLYGRYEGTDDQHAA